MTLINDNQYSLDKNYLKNPRSMNLIVNEYQVYDVTPLKKRKTMKRRFLCSTNYFFFEDENEDNTEKLQVTIKDNWGDVCLNQYYNRIDRCNRKFPTNQ